MTGASSGASDREQHAEEPGGKDAFRLAAEPPRVMRLSRKALALVGGAAGIAIGGALLWALRPAGHQPAENLYDAAGNSPSEAVTRAPKDYGAVPKLGPPLPGDLGRPIVSAQQNGTAVPVPPIGQTSPDPARAAAAQARQRAAQEKEAARASRIFGSARDMAAADGPARTPEPAGPDQLPQNGRPAFLSARSSRPVESSERLNPPSAEYILQAGSIIPAALITGIKSDLPGQITAQVTQNIYDSPTGRHLLIPQGARLIGEYDSEVGAGQNRVLLAWDRLILPGGRSILLDRQPAGDAAGMAGLADRTDYHWGGVLRAALVSTLLGAGTELGVDSDDRLARALREGSQDTINQTGGKLVEREIGIAPSITIRPGFIFRILVTRDLILEPQGEGR